MNILLNSNLKKKQFTIYRCILSILSICIFFSGLDSYLYSLRLIPPIYQVIIVFILASIPIIITLQSRISSFPIRIIVWCYLYLFISISSTLLLKAPDSVSLQALDVRIRDAVFLILMLVIFSGCSITQLWAKRSILGITIISTFNNIYEFFNPSAFGSSQILGRVAGWYDHANNSGMALVFGMIISVEILKNKNIRIFYTLLISLGVVVTFSRGSQLCLLISVTYLAVSGVLSRQRTFAILLILSLILTVFTTQVNNVIYLKRSDGSRYLNKNTINRIEWMLNPLSKETENESQVERKELFDEAWNKFSKRPFLGHGLNQSTSRKQSPNSKSSDISGNLVRPKPHNMYLVFMVEHGIIGLFIYPSLLISSAWKKQGKLASTGIIFVIVFLFRGLFSHTLLHSRFFLLGVALVATTTSLNSKLAYDKRLSAAKFKTG